LSGRAVMPKRPSRRLMCDNTLFNIFFEKVKLRNGTIIPNYLVVSPKQKSKMLVSGVSVLPVVDGQIALLRIYRYPIQGESWEIPRGFIEKGESSTQSVIRELKEETGLTCRKSDLHSLGFMTPEAGVFEARAQLFVAENCKMPESFSMNELGHRELKLLTYEQVARMIQRRKIQDPSTIICFYHYSEFLRKQK